jgi:hypothetical protein
VKQLLSFLIAAALLLAGSETRAQEAWTDDCARAEKPPLLQRGCAVLDGFMAAFNSKDGPAWAATLNYPHVRLAGDEVLVWATPEDYARSNDVRELGKSG